MDPIKDSITVHMAACLEELETQVNVVKSFALNSAKKLNERLEVHVLDTDWKAKAKSKPPAAK
jgi:hypothetical protein